jgi:hypothetical protein
VTKLLAGASPLVLIGSFGVAALFVASPPSFAVARSYAAGRVPSSVAIDDLKANSAAVRATRRSSTL